MNEKNSFTSKQKVYLVFKRFFDIVISFIAILFCLIFIWPLITIINLLVTRGHPFFLPLRLGKNNKPFKMFKFRTMKVDTPDLPTDKFEDAEKYVTRMGKILRKTSLDEMPQLFNILVGQMSFIGPRPALWNQEAKSLCHREEPLCEDGYSSFFHRERLGFVLCVRSKSNQELHLMKRFASSRFSLSLILPSKSLA